MAEAPSPKIEQVSCRPTDLSAEEAEKTRGGIDFIAAKNKIDETYNLPVNAAKKATW